MKEYRYIEAFDDQDALRHEIGVSPRLEGVGLGPDSLDGEMTTATPPAPPPDCPGAVLLPLSRFAHRVLGEMPMDGQTDT